MFRNKSSTSEVDELKREVDSLKREIEASKIRASLSNQTIHFLLENIAASTDLQNCAFEKITEPAKYNLHEFHINNIRDGAKLEEKVSDEYQKWFREICERLADT
ncbi:hypothetical protein [Hoeflea sp. TYP-13]|uniref:hypothetical protein n=1 Tax=Hoeflea sp. TYP-13 TaxID=3230023 RepID=UPI0034C66C76